MYSCRKERVSVIVINSDSPSDWCLFIRQEMEIATQMIMLIVSDEENNIANFFILISGNMFVHEVFFPDWKAPWKIKIGSEDKKN